MMRVKISPDDFLETKENVSTTPMRQRPAKHRGLTSTLLLQEENCLGSMTREEKETYALHLRVDLERTEGEMIRTKLIQHQ